MEGHEATTGAAFDLMTVNPKTFHLISKSYPALKAVFREELDYMLENKKSYKIRKGLRDDDFDHPIYEELPESWPKKQAKFIKLDRPEDPDEGADNAVPPNKMAKLDTPAEENDAAAAEKKSSSTT